MDCIGWQRKHSRNCGKVVKQGGGSVGKCQQASGKESSSRFHRQGSTEAISSQSNPWLAAIGSQSKSVCSSTGGRTGLFKQPDGVLFGRMRGRCATPTAWLTLASCRVGDRARQDSGDSTHGQGSIVRPWRSPRWRGSTGATHAGDSSRAAPGRSRSTRRVMMNRPRWPDSTSPYEIPGTVQLPNSGAHHTSRCLHILGL